MENEELAARAYRRWRERIHELQPPETPQDIHSTWKDLSEDMREAWRAASSAMLTKGDAFEVRKVMVVHLSLARATFTLSATEAQRLIDGIQNETGDKVLLTAFTALRKGDVVLIKSVKSSEESQVDAKALFEALKKEP